MFSYAIRRVSGARSTRCDRLVWYMSTAPPRRVKKKAGRPCILPPGCTRYLRITPTKSGRRPWVFVARDGSFSPRRLCSNTLTALTTLFLHAKKCRSVRNGKKECLVCKQKHADLWPRVGYRNDLVRHGARSTADTAAPVGPAARGYQLGTRHNLLVLNLLGTFMLPDYCVQDSVLCGYIRLHETGECLKG